MIKEAMTYVVQELNGYFHQVLSPKPVRELVSLSTIVDQNGEISVQDEATLICSLLNIEEEKKGGATNGRNDRRQPINLVLYTMISAYFPGKLTGEALGFLSMVIQYFDENPVFNTSISPGLDSGIHRMSWEIYNPDFMEVSNLWGAVGAKLMPSVIYKVRLLQVPKERLQSKVPVIQEIDIQTSIPGPANKLFKDQ